MKEFNASSEMQDLQYFSKFGRMNSSISDSSTHTSLSAKTITAILVQICKSGDHIISSRAKYVFLKNLIPSFRIDTTFLDFNNIGTVEKAIQPNTRVIYCESVSNPLLEVADLRTLSALYKNYHIRLIAEHFFSFICLTGTAADIVQETLLLLKSDGLIRFSIRLGHDIRRTYEKMKECMLKTGILNHETISIS